MKITLETDYRNIIYKSPAIEEYPYEIYKNRKKKLSDIIIFVDNDSEKMIVIKNEKAIYFCCSGDVSSNLKNSGNLYVGRELEISETHLKLSKIIYIESIGYKKTIKKVVSFFQELIKKYGYSIKWNMQKMSYSITKNGITVCSNYLSLSHLAKEINPENWIVHEMHKNAQGNMKNNEKRAFSIAKKAMQTI